MAKPTKDPSPQNESVPETKAMVIKVPKAMKPTEDVLSALARLPEEIQKNLAKAMTPLAPAKRGMKMASGSRKQFPFLNLMQKSTSNAPDECKPGHFFDDAMTALGTELVGYVLLFKEERVFFSGTGLACRSPDREHSIRGVYCEQCPEKPTFRKDGSGKVFKDGGCDDCIGMVILLADLSGMFRYTLKGKAGQPAQKMLKKLLPATDEIFSRAYRFYGDKREAGSNTYHAHLVEVARDEKGEEISPTADEAVVVDFLFEKVLEWSDQDDAEAARMTKEASGADGGSDGPQRGSYGPGAKESDTVDVEGSTVIGEDEAEDAETVDIEDHAGSL